jgi:hypothetical protein
VRHFISFTVIGFLAGVCATYSLKHGFGLLTAGAYHRQRRCLRFAQTEQGRRSAGHRMKKNVSIISGITGPGEQLGNTRLAAAQVLKLRL